MLEVIHRTTASINDVDFSWPVNRMTLLRV